MKRPFSYILVSLLGILPGFFVVFNSIFTDTSGSMSERLFTFLLVIVSYAIPGAVLGYMGPATSWRWGIWLSIPAIVLVVFYTIKEPGLILLNFVYVFLTFASASLAAYYGANFVLRKKGSR